MSSTGAKARGAVSRAFASSCLREGRRAWLALVLAALALTGVACRRAPADVEPPPPQTSGTITLDGLHAPVSVVRDARGVPHISAANADDLFFAQGFVQAQDRLFQMDLWKRAAQGRLSEVLGANFIQRDSMTRRIQFRGDYAREWASYGPDTERIAVAFTSGINAWVRQARQHPPEEFVAAGWLPDLWKPEDLLNRTDAWLASRGAIEDVFTTRLVAAVGLQRAEALFPLPGKQHITPDPAVDLQAVSFVVGDGLRRIGTAPFFLTLTGKVVGVPRRGRTGDPGPEPTQPTDATPATPLLPGRLWLVDSAGSDAGAPLLGVSETSGFDAPSARYLVHLTAPGWNVAGATAPWRPGVAIGHNDQLAWAMTPSGDDTADVFVEHVNPANPHQVRRDGRWVDMQADLERVDVKGRERPPQHERLRAPSGVVIAEDSERHLFYTLRWTGMEYGGAGELAALALSRAGSVAEAREALQHWTAPASIFALADRSGGVARVRAGLVPTRPAGYGHMTMDGESVRAAWLGYEPRVLDVDAGLEPLGRTSTSLFQAVNDVNSPGARSVLAMIEQIRSNDTSTAELRSRLLAWSGRFDGASRAQNDYEQLLTAVRRELAEAAAIPGALREESLFRIDPVALLLAPTQAWIPEASRTRRDEILSKALSMVGGRRREADDGQAGPSDQAGQAGQSARTSGGTPPPLFFRHVLAVFTEGQRRFNIGPITNIGGPDTLRARSSARGTTFEAVFDLADWNRTTWLNAPGQSGSPSSPHYDDLVQPWTSGTGQSLPFDQTIVSSAAAETLRLVPPSP